MGETEQSRLVQAGIYCRVSTEDQAGKGASLEAQEEYLLAWAENENIEVKPDHIYIDEVSGKDLKRPALTKLRADAKAGNFEVLLVYHNDRLSRDTKDTLNLVEELHMNGVKTRCSNVDTDITTAEGELLFTMLSGFATYFRKDLARKTSLGMQKRKRGGTHIGRLSDQFERIDTNRPLTSDNVRVKPDCKDLVEKIYIGYDRGDSARSLAKQYDLGKASGHKTVKRIVEMVEWLKGGPNAIKFEYGGKA